MNFQILFISILFYFFIAPNHTKIQTFPEAKNIQAKVEGFSVQEVLKGSGEYLSIATDPQGRLIISPRFGSILRMTVDVEQGQVGVDTLNLQVEDCQGLLYAYGHLYAMGTGAGRVRGVYRIPDLNGLGNYGTPILMKEFPKNGDHSGHTLTKGPDGMIYFLSGNVNKVPKGSDVSYINDDWHADHPMMLESIYGSDQTPPGGFVMRTDSVGSHWTLYAMGLRNPYDMCFNASGELFTFDSDMEWDFNLPWYRPTRVNHLVSGSDFAWRPFNGKRYDHYPDVWPAVLDFGRGSPTATVFGTGTNFPEKYQRALFLGDWSYGKIYALHLNEKGSTYGGAYEVFATGKPLNITDMVSGHDGALYFVTGGNGTDTGLFRIAWNGSKQQSVGYSPNTLRQLRHKIEAYHSAEDSSGLAIALQYIGHQDHFIRYAARIILERNDPNHWIAAFDHNLSFEGESNLLTALIRSEEPAFYGKLIVDKLTAINFTSLRPDQQAGLLRLCVLYKLRNPTLEKQELSRIYKYLLPHYPSDHSLVNKELSRTLAFFSGGSDNNESFITHTIQLLESSNDSKMIIHYLEMLRNVQQGWTDDLRIAFRHWANYAINNWSGGSLYTFFVKQILQDFEGHLSPDKIKWLNEIENKPFNPAYNGPFKAKKINRVAASAGNGFVKNWAYEDLEYSLELVNSPRGGRQRDLHRGYQMLDKGLCFNCHYIFNRGGAFGPELTLASNSFGVEELLRTTIYPSEAINSRFQSTEFDLKDNEFTRGRIMNESETHYVIQLDWTGNTIEEIPKESITNTTPSALSDMPPGLINSMQKNEILDLLYFISELPGNIDDPMTFDILENKTYAAFGDSILIEIMNYSNQGNLFYQIDHEPFQSYQGPFYVYDSKYITAYKQLEDSLTEIKSRMVHFYDPDKNGLNYAVYTGVTKRLDQITTAPNIKGIARSFDITRVVQDIDNFEIRLDGYLNVEESGEYLFYAEFDDALKFYVNDQLLIFEKNRRWGSNSQQCIYLEKGLVPIKAYLYDELSTEYLNIEYEGPNFRRKVIPAHQLFLKK